MNRRLWLAVLVAGLLAAVPASATASGIYVSNFASNSVSPFSILSSGALSPIACDPATSCLAGNKPKGIAIDPSGRFAYVVNSNAFTASPGSVSVYSIGAGGSLTPIACDPATSCKTGNGPDGIAVDPRGRFVYVANVNAISVFSIGATGALTPVACDPLTNCSTGSSNAVAIDPGGRYVYATDSDGDAIRVFSIGATGTLTPVACDPATDCAAGDDPWAITIHPSGDYLYSINRNPPHGVHAYAIGAGGALTPITCSVATDCETGTYPDDIAVDPSGRFVYVTGNDDDSVSVFRVTVPPALGTPGALTPVPCDPAVDCKTGAASFGLTVDPPGEHVYVSNRDDDSVSVYSIGPSGTLSPVNCDPATDCKTGDAPNHFSIEASPDRGPTAAFSVSAPAGATVVALDATASTSPDYPIAQYAWDFGDGQTETSLGPTVLHTYPGEGTYTAELTVTDAIGCSTSIVYTGQTASCNGTAKARTTRQVTISTTPPGGDCEEAEQKLAQAKKKLKKAKKKLKKLKKSGASAAKIKKAKKAVKKAKKAVKKANQAVDDACP
jgi:6-phosphogluconolactonase (cycloisomerase 2 family)